MKNKLINLIAIIAIVIIALVVLTGCGDKKEEEKPLFEGVEVSETLNRRVGFSVSVPKNEDGTPKYTLTETKPEGMSASGTFFLETDTAIIGFEVKTLLYNTALAYKEKHGDTEATFDGYVAWIDEGGIKLGGMEKLTIDGKSAIRYYNRYGSPGSYKYDGYNYIIDIDDVYPRYQFNMNVCYKDAEKPTEAKEFDEETLAIIKSLKLTAVEQ